MLVADYDRIRKGKPLSMRPSLSHAGNFLWMLNGENPPTPPPAPWMSRSSCMRTTS